MKNLRMICFFSLLVLMSFMSIAQAADPKVNSISPADNATNVPVTTTVVVTFNNTMRWDRVYRTSDEDYPYRIFLRKYNTTTPIPCTYSPTSNNSQYTLTPVSALQANTRYEVVLYADRLRDTSDNKLSDTSGYGNWYITDFITAAGGASDTTRPIVEGTYPADGDVSVPIGVRVDVTFSEDIASGDVSSTYFKVYRGSVSGTAVTISSFAYDAATNTAQLTLPTLANSTTYYVVVKSGIHDLATTPNTLQNDYTFDFTTAAVTDTISPTITARTPGIGSTGEAVTVPIKVTFSENIDATTLTSASFTVSGGVTPVGNAISYDSVNRVATFTPSVNLSYATNYTVTLTSSVRDVAGNALAAATGQPLSWTFTTVSGTASTATLNEYCQVPPFLSTGSSVKPNVLLIVDNSGSMETLAYALSNYDSTKSYGGYFDKNRMYKYNSTSGWFEPDTTTAHNPATNWTGGTSVGSGNFLNWMTMRRVDVVRQVLVGGKQNARTGQTNYYRMPYAGGNRSMSYNNTYYQYGSSGGVPIIKICTSSSCKSFSGGNYNAYVYVGSNPSDGLVQKMADRIRFGLMTFNNDGTAFEEGDTSVKDGGQIVIPIGATDNTNVNASGNIVSKIETANPNTWTPLAESLYEAVRYFQFTNSAYNGFNYSTTAIAPLTTATDPIAAPCQKNFVMLLTDGESTKDQNLPGGSFTGTEVSDNYGFNVETWRGNVNANTTVNNAVIGATTIAASLNSSSGTNYLPAAAYYAHKTDLRSATVGGSAKVGMQNLTIYTVFAFDNSVAGANLLKLTSLYGAYTDTNNNNIPDLQSEYDTTNNSTGLKVADGIPDTYFPASDGDSLQISLQKAFDDIVARVASGTAASILNNSDGSGASLLQAVFYPKKTFEGGTEVSWIGELQNMWYYLDPFLNYPSIRIDTNSDFKLNTKQDEVVQFWFDGGTNGTNQTYARLLSDTKGDGSTLTTVGSTYNPDDTSVVKSLWRAGRKLWSRDAGTRSILTNTGINTLDISNGFASFDTSLSSNTTVQSYLQAANSTEADKIINFIRGTDQSGYRIRSVTIGGSSGTWRLGDIISSSPKILGNVSLNTYSQLPPTGYNDSSYLKYTKSNTYGNRGMAFVGANDGMLHAFRLGVLKELTDPCRLSGANSATCAWDKAKMNNYTTETALTTKYGQNSNVTATSSDDLGREEWAYIPKNMLPYLKYLGDPSYAHLFYVDGVTNIIDASINSPSTCTALNYWDCAKQTKYLTVEGNSEGTVGNLPSKNLDLSNTSWRSILIGSTGLGGASRNRGGTGACNGGGTECVKTPVDGVGFSEYFALDVTNPSSPVYKWTFNGDTSSGGNLGYATTGPAIMRLGSGAKNGRWFAVFASGPTGGINTTSRQFMGKSDQNLRIFIVDLASGTLLKTIDTGIANAYAGSLSNSAIDLDRSNQTKSGHYQDDGLYIGYVEKDTATGTWTKGGVVRLLTNESIDPNDSTKPWIASKVIDGIGPVTTAVSKLQDRSNNNLWLYFGTGRYYYKSDVLGIDDSDGNRSLYGLKEPCYNAGAYTSGCTTKLIRTNLKDQTLTPTAAIGAYNGWYNNLDSSALNDGYSSERVITDPVASPSGVVFFTTFRPTTDVCGFGGNSFIWAVDYSTGGTPSSKAMKGSLMIQVSTGAFAELSMADDFGAKDGRRNTTAIQGVPPKAQGLSLMANPRPIKKVLQIQEK